MALKLKSNNTQGNPYHDEEGKFTSEGNVGAKTEKKSSDPLMNLFGSLGKSMRDSEAEEKEAMKLFGLNKKEESKPSKKSFPDEIGIADSDDESFDFYKENGYTIDVSTEDIIDYLKQKGATLSESDIADIENDREISESIYNDYFDEDEFKEYIRNKNSDNVKEQLENVKENEEFSKDPDKFYGLRR